MKLTLNIYIASWICPKPPPWRKGGNMEFRRQEYEQRDNAKSMPLWCRGICFLVILSPFMVPSIS